MKRKPSKAVLVITIQEEGAIERATQIKAERQFLKRFATSKNLEILDIEIIEKEFKTETLVRYSKKARYVIFPNVFPEMTIKELYKVIRELCMKHKLTPVFLNRLGKNPYMPSRLVKKQCLMNGRIYQKNLIEEN